VSVTNFFMQIVKDVYSLGISLNSRILVCMPHPDDEAVFIGGTLYKLFLGKIPTRVLTFSRGERSSLRYRLDKSADLGKVRSIELKNALKILGIKDLKIFDFGDGNLKNRGEEILSCLRKEISLYRPSHIITLEPNGIYGHPDHISLSKFVSEVSDPPVKTLYATVSINYILPRQAIKLAEKVVKPSKPQFIMKLGLAASIKKLLALKSHQSQFRFDMLHWQSFLFFLKNKMLSREYFL